MKKYLLLLTALTSIGLKKYLENRWNTVGYISASLASLLLYVVFIQVYFNFSGEIGGWNKYQTLLLLGLYRTVVPIFNLLFFKSILDIPNAVRTGQLDIFLQKPVNSQFLLSFRFIRIYDVVSTLSGIVLISYAFSNLNISLDFLNWIALIIGIISGVVIFYSIFFCICTLSLWFTKFDSAETLYYMTRDVISVPTDFYGYRIQALMTYFIPLTFILTVPVKVFFGKLGFGHILITCIVAYICLKFSSWFWNFALRHYTSASS